MLRLCGVATCGVLLTGAIASANLTSTPTQQATALPVSSTDLLQTTAVTGLGSEESATNVTPTVLFNGAFDTGATPTTERWTATTGDFAQFTLAGPTNLTTISTFAQWGAGSGGRSGQIYSIVVRDATTGVESTLVPQTSYFTDSSDGLFTRVVHSDDLGGPIATNVDRVRFNFFGSSGAAGTPAPGPQMYREIDIEGVPVPEPTAAMTGLLLTGGALLRRRRGT